MTESVYIFMRGAGCGLSGNHPIDRITALVEFMLECVQDAAQERDQPASLIFYEQEH